MYDDFASSLKTQTEINFLKNIFNKNQKIIEFGCGTGRTLVPLLKNGYKISGLDISKGMLKHLNRKLKEKGLKTQIYNKNLVNFSLRTKFEGGILSQRTLNFITGEKEQRKALENIAKVFKKGATLVINLMPARPDDFASVQKTLKKTETFFNSSTKKKVEFWESWVPNPREQIWSLENEFLERTNHRWLSDCRGGWARRYGARRPRLSDSTGTVL